jgi:hypothetical protein
MGRSVSATIIPRFKFPSLKVRLHRGVPLSGIGDRESLPGIRRRRERKWSRRRGGKREHEVHYDGNLRKWAYAERCIVQDQCGHQHPHDKGDSGRGRPERPSARQHAVDSQQAGFEAARAIMAKTRKRRYSRGSQSEVKNEMHRYKRGKAKSGRGGKGGKVKSRKQAIAIGLSKARKKGK